MLVYHPYFDVHHCVFRMLRLLANVNDTEIELQRFRTWDFFLLFPTALLRSHLPRGANAKLRSYLKSRDGGYEVLPDARRIFFQLESIQDAALAKISSRGIINPDLLKSRDIIKKENFSLPHELASRVSAENREDEVVVVFLTSVYLDLELYGKNGMRSRLDFFDSKYDLK